MAKNQIVLIVLLSAVLYGSVQAVRPQAFTHFFAASASLLHHALAQTVAPIDPAEFDIIKNICISMGTTAPASWNCSAQSTDFCKPGSSIFEGIYCQNINERYSITEFVMYCTTRPGVNPTFPAGSLDNLADLPNLYLMNVVSCNFTGTLPAQYSQLSRIELDTMDISGTIPSSYFSSATLGLLRLNTLNLVGPLPQFGATILDTLELGDMPQLGGPLPELSTSAKASISGVYPSSSSLIPLCGFTGEIPSSWAEASILTTLRLNHNKLGPNLPAALPPGVIYAEFRDNAFRGTVPSYSNYSSIVYLLLGDNQLSGTLPDSLGALFNPDFGLDISNNSFVGTIPAAWAGTNLSFISFDDNQFAVGCWPKNFTAKQCYGSSAFCCSDPAPNCNTPRCLECQSCSLPIPTPTPTPTPVPTFTPSSLGTTSASVMVSAVLACLVASIL